MNEDFWSFLLVESLASRRSSEADAGAEADRVPARPFRVLVRDDAEEVIPERRSGLPEAVRDVHLNSFPDLEVHSG